MKSQNLAFFSKPAIISPLGIGLKKNLEKILKGESALQKDEKILKKQIFIGRVKESLQDIKIPHYNTRTNRLLLRALLQIEKEILKAIEKYGEDKIGVVIGTTTTGIEENFEIFKNYQKSKTYDKKLYHHKMQALSNPADFVKDFYSLKSICFSISTACTSGAKALIYAKELIQSGICKAVICGGVDSLNTLTLNGFDSLALLSENISNPFSKNRDGINIGEAATLFLASKDEISPIYLAGDATNNDAFHITKPDTSAKKQIEAIEEALKKANLQEVDYINLHSTGTKANDIMESRAIAKTLPFVSASSTKPLMGHTLGAAGAVEAGICYALMNEEKSFLPPHVYDGEYDNDLDKINLVKKGDKKMVKSALSSSFAFGGDNAILILRRSS